MAPIGEAVYAARRAILATKLVRYRRSRRPPPPRGIRWRGGAVPDDREVVCGALGHREPRQADLGYTAFVTEPGATMTYLSDVQWKLSERPFLLVVQANGASFFVSPGMPGTRACRVTTRSVGPIQLTYQRRDPLAADVARAS